MHEFIKNKKRFTVYIGTRTGAYHGRKEYSMLSISHNGMEIHL